MKADPSLRLQCPIETMVQTHTKDETEATTTEPVSEATTTEATTDTETEATREVEDKRERSVVMSEIEGGGVTTAEMRGHRTRDKELSVLQSVLQSSPSLRPLC